MGFSLPGALQEILGSEMRGNIYCAKCSAPRSKASCPTCGHDRCFLRLKFKGRSERFWTDPATLETYTFKGAFEVLIKINNELSEKTFDPAHYREDGIRARLFENSIAEWLNRKEKDMASGWFAPGTLHPYRSYAKIHFIPHFKGLDVTQIQQHHIQAFLDHLPADLSMHYRRNLFRALQTFFRWLNRWNNKIPVPIFPELRGPKTNKEKPISFIRQMEGISRIPERHRDIFYFATETALRIGEVCALQARDFELDRRRVLIQRTYSHYKLRETTKQGRGDYIPLSDRALSLANRNLKSKIGTAWAFTREGSHGYRPAYLRKLWRQYSGISEKLYVSVRHSTLSEWAAQGANAFEIKDLGRHSDIRTSSVYVQSAQGKLYDIVNRKRGR